MNELNLKPDHDAGHGGDKQIAIPALADAATLVAARRSGVGTRSPRRRFRATRLALATDDGLRPFRIY
ncbi:MAG TPA: hypothetical protein VN859_05480 [Steroidobacteraceae bacterium]|nr:hypothetical protein [Steroidobacteraceae bacterium]